MTPSSKSQLIFLKMSATCHKKWTRFEQLLALKFYTPGWSPYFLVVQCKPLGIRAALFKYNCTLIAESSIFGTVKSKTDYLSISHCSVLLLLASD